MDIHAHDLFEGHRKATAHVYLHGFGRDDIRRELDQPLVVWVSTPGKEVPLPPGLLGERATNEYVKQFTEPGTRGFRYTYGDRITSHFGVNQIDKVINELKANHDSRRAVITIPDPHVDIGIEIPCLQMIQFWVDRCGFLETYAVFRSHDIYGAWFSNCKAIVAVSRRISGQVGAPLGDLVVFSMCPHVYLYNSEEIEKYCQMPGWTNEIDMARTLF